MEHIAPVFYEEIRTDALARGQPPGDVDDGGQVGRRQAVERVIDLGDRRGAAGAVEDLPSQDELVARADGVARRREDPRAVEHLLSEVDRRVLPPGQREG